MSGDKPFFYYPVMAGFIRMPPAEMGIEEARNNSLFVEPDALSDKDCGTCYTINRKAHEFERDGNPVDALDAFVRAVGFGVYPPKNVLQWMAGVLQQYLDAEGGKSLDRCFGTQGAASGQDPAYKRLLIKQRNDALMHEMTLLMSIGASRWDAAEMVAEKAGLRTDGHTKHKINRMLDTGTLVTYHKRSRVKPDPETKEWLMRNPRLISELLSEYPDVPATARLRSKHKGYL